MSRRSAILPVALAAALLALPACGSNKPTAGTMTPPPGGIPTPTPGVPKGPGVPRVPGPGDPNAGQPNTGQTADPSLPSPPAPQGLSDPASRMTSNNNLKQIGIAFHNALSTYNAFPIGIADKSGKVGLSWRVAILPYIEQDTLYKQFKLDEPWDSEHNKKLISKMPKEYAPTKNSETNGYTYYRSFTGPDAIMPASRPGQPGKEVLGSNIQGITDGTSNTLLVAEATDPVIWTKPDDLPFDKNQAPPKLGGGAFKDGFNAVLCDGSTRWFKAGTAADKIKALITPRGGEIVKFDD